MSDATQPQQATRHDGELDAAHDPTHSPLLHDTSEALHQGQQAARWLRIPDSLKRGHNWWQLLKFGMVGGSGYVVNLAVFTLALRLLGESPADGIKDYHVAAVLGFMVANLNNYVLNRVWTFRGRGGGGAVLEYGRFLAIGIVSLLLGLVILTALVEALELPQLLAHTGVSDLGKIIAQAIAIVLVTPIGFVGNKLWTFRGYR